MPARPSGSSAKADVAIIFVHGIGTQREGEMLAAGVGCFRLALPSDAMIEDAPPVAGRRATRVVWEEPGAGRRTALCIDGWWDDLVDSPLGRPWATLLWLTIVAPAIHAASVMFGISAAASNQPKRGAAVARQVLGFVARALVAGPFLVLASVGVALCLALELAAARIAGRPRRLAGMLSGVAGDAWAYSRGADRDAALARLERTCSDAARRSRRVVVVGHSQGGALSRAVCRSKRDVVTVGSGANLLAIARTAHPIALGWSWLALTTVPLLLIGAVAAQWEALQPAFDLQRDYWRTVFSSDGASTTDITTFLHDFSGAMADASWTPGDTVVALLAGVAVAVGLAVAFVTRASGTPDEWATPSARWVDVMSPWDPVCVGGTLSDPAGEQLVVINASRIRELLREHTAYFENPAVAQVIADVACGRPLTSVADPVTPYRRATARCATVGLAATTVGLWIFWAWLIAKV